MPLSSKRALLALGLLFVLGGCVSQPADSVAPSAAEFNASIDAALTNLEKMEPEGRREAKESLDELFETRANADQKARYQKLIGG